MGSLLSLCVPFLAIRRAKLIYLASGFDTCISMSSGFKHFFLFLCVVPPLVLHPVYYLVPILARDIRLVTKDRWNSNHLYALISIRRFCSDLCRHDIWWNRKRSWIGGPVFRYARGLYYCYQQAPKTTNRLPRSSFLARPRLLPLFICISGIVVAVMALAMISMSLLNLRRGLYQVEIE